VDVVTINNGKDSLKTRSRSKRQRPKNEQKLSSLRRRRAGDGDNVIINIAAGGLSSLIKGGLIFCSAMLTYSVVNNFDEGDILSYLRRASSKAGSKAAVKLHIPSGLDDEMRRSLSLNLGEGECLWQVSYSYLNFLITGRIMADCISNCTLHLLNISCISNKYS
jgi:hypothetical protein